MPMITPGNATSSEFKKQVEWTAEDEGLEPLVAG